MPKMYYICFQQYYPEYKQDYLQTRTNLYNLTHNLILPKCDDNQSDENTINFVSFLFNVGMLLFIRILLPPIQTD